MTKENITLNLTMLNVAARRADDSKLNMIASINYLEKMSTESGEKMKPKDEKRKIKLEKKIKVLEELIEYIENKTLQSEKFEVNHELERKIISIIELEKKTDISLSTIKE